MKNRRWIILTPLLSLVMVFWWRARQPKSPEPYLWSAVVSAPECGLIESTSRRMYQAPEGGYQKAFTYQETGQ